MTDKESLPATAETRCDRVIKVVLSLSECEQEELRSTLATLRLSRLTARLGDWQTCLAVALHSGAIFGLFFGVLIGLLSIDPTLGLLRTIIAFSIASIYSGVFCGALMTLILACTYRVAYPHLLANLVNKKTTTFQVEEFDLQLPASECLTLCRTAIEATKGARIDKLDETSGEIRAVKRMSWSSPGEAIGMKLDQIDSERTRVKVYSKDLFNSWALGKNRANVRKLKAAIEEAAQVHRILRDHGHGSEI